MRYHHQAASTLRLLTILPLGIALIVAAGSGRAGTAVSSRANESSGAGVKAAAIAAGAGHSCALTRAGGVKCWGYNGHDELGDGRGDSRKHSTPVDVSGLGSGVTAISAGERHSCALTAAGGVKCWGANYGGALGDGTTDRHPAPVDVVGLSSGVTAIAAGLDDSCALTSRGGVKCWGDNSRGQLGDGTSTDHSMPVDVSGLSSGVTAIAAGALHTCALMTTGGVKCWGGNYGSSPVDVSGLSRAIAITERCAIIDAGAVKCWGGDAGLTAVDVPGLGSGARGIATGGTHSCAFTSAGNVKCWGANNGGQIGDGTTDDRSTPVAVSGLSGVTAIAAGAFHSCAVTRAGGVQCWGVNGTGQLGDGTTSRRLRPVDVIGFAAGRATLAIVSRSVKVTPAGVAAVMLRCGGPARCKGALTLTAPVEGKLAGSSARHVQLRLGSRPFSIAAASTPTIKVKLTGRSFELLARVKRLPAQLRIRYKQPAGGTTTATRMITLTAAKRAAPSATVPATAVAVGIVHSCALTRTGGVECWGHNFESELGDRTTVDRSRPVSVAGLSRGVTAIAAGSSHSCALTSAGGVRCWGANFAGELGDGTTSRRSMPVEVSGLSAGVRAIAAGGHTCALIRTGGVKCWGLNNYGQLGDGTTSMRPTPVDVSGLSGVTAIAVGFGHSCALTGSGGVKCWGLNNYGQLGAGGSGNLLTPVDVSGLSGVTAIAAGDSHSCALTSAGVVKCWGANAAGQLGDGTTGSRSIPVDVSGRSGVTAIAAGGSHSCALTSTGGVKCWGANFAGQLGDGGGAFQSSTPVVVSGLSGVAAIAAGGQHSCALTRSGGVKCWGDNSAGQLGDGTTRGRPTPVRVIGFGRGKRLGSTGADDDG